MVLPNLTQIVLRKSFLGCKSGAMNRNKGLLSKDIKIASTSVIMSSLELRGSFWFCQRGSIRAQRGCKNWTPHGECKVEIPVQLSRADSKVHPETQNFLESLQPQNKGSISFNAAPKKGIFYVFQSRTCAHALRNLSFNLA